MGVAAGLCYDSHPDSVLGEDFEDGLFQPCLERGKEKEPMRRIAHRGSGLGYISLFGASHVLLEVKNSYSN